jgi:hypothetical protein
MMYPWERPGVSEEVEMRAPKMEISRPWGPRYDLPRRQPAIEVAPSLRGYNFGAAIMTHRGYSNGRLSVLLSSLPENLPVVVSSDSIDERDIEGDRQVCEHHGAKFVHSTPWGGRAKNAIHTMVCHDFDPVLFLNDDTWLFPETPYDGLRWYHIIRNTINEKLAAVGFPIWSTFENYKSMGYDSWEQVLDDPYRCLRLSQHPQYSTCPALYKNPFGACMMINRAAYDDLGGFTEAYWAEDDVFSHQVWTSGRWFNVAVPGRGFIHLGAQSWHFGESQEYVNDFYAATGMTAEQSGAKQVESIYKWIDRIGPGFCRIGGVAGV